MHPAKRKKMYVHIAISINFKVAVMAKVTLADYFDFLICVTEWSK